MRSRSARVVMIILGALLILTGVVWIGQGLGLIPGSVMTGDRTWFYVGIVMVVAGAVALALSLRRPRSG
jgi:Na+/melibiose symporter-like transporter